METGAGRRSDHAVVATVVVVVVVDVVVVFVMFDQVVVALPSSISNGLFVTVVN